MYTLSENEPHARLATALVDAAKTASVRLVSSSARPWASITFAGQRHRFAIFFGGPEAEAMARRMAGALACDEFDIHGHLVADIAAGEPCAMEDGYLLDVEALTVEAS